MTNSNEIPSIAPNAANEVLKRDKSSCVLLDVRSVGEFSSLHASEAMNIPLHTLTSETLQPLRGKKVICICQKGGRGEQAARLLLGNGFSEVWNVEGGTEAWAHAGLPILRGKSCISMERQVRIAAGTLVSLGVLGGHFITPYAFLISLFVGCGLIFSGISNTCGMALVLARCPWNSR